MSRFDRSAICEGEQPSGKKDSHGRKLTKDGDIIPLVEYGDVNVGDYLAHELSIRRNFLYDGIVTSLETSYDYGEEGIREGGADWIVIENSDGKTHKIYWDDMDSVARYIPRHKLVTASKIIEPAEMYLAVTKTCKEREKHLAKHAKNVDIEWNSGDLNVSQTATIILRFYGSRLRDDLKSSMFSNGVVDHRMALSYAQELYNDNGTLWALDFSANNDLYIDIDLLATELNEQLGLAVTLTVV